MIIIASIVLIILCCLFGIIMCCLMKRQNKLLKQIDTLNQEPIHSRRVISTSYDIDTNTKQQDIHFANEGNNVIANILPMTAEVIPNPEGFNTGLNEVNPDIIEINSTHGNNDENEHPSIESNNDDDLYSQTGTSK